MMPMYTWHDTNTGLEVEVVRSLDGSDVPPTEEETKEQNTEPPVRNWIKLLQSVRVVKGDTWGRGKGHW